MATLPVLLLLLGLAGLEAASSPYCKVCSDHTMCKFPTTKPGPACGKSFASRSLTAAEKNLIVKTHNELRNRVALGQEKRGLNGHSQPSAANMRKITWDDELATIAQRWANQCKFDHDTCRSTLNKEWAGQCIMESYDGNGGKTVDWAGEIKGFYEEVKDRDGSLNTKPFRQDPPGRMTGHYTQLVWADTHKVGCGFADYKSSSFNGWMRLAVCNYGPTGNVFDETTYMAGSPASKCPKGTRNDRTYPGLCA